jgi:23S rRNA pseudouridine2457 synthase
VAQIVHQLGGVGRVNAAPNQRRNDDVIGAVGFSQLYGEFDISPQNLAYHNGQRLFYRQEGLYSSSDEESFVLPDLPATPLPETWFCRDSLEALSYFTAMLIVFNKPYGVLSQFTREASSYRPLAEFGFPKKVYPVGRLDADSEGLLLLSDEPQLNQLLLHPRHAHQREYWAQVEHVPTAQVLRRLAAGLVVQGRTTLPGRAWKIEPQPEIPPRDPPIRFRKTVPACWIGLELTEGRNRQVRRMTAAIGHPTLRLIRVRIGGFRLGSLAPGTWRELKAAERKMLLS